MTQLMGIEQGSTTKITNRIKAELVVQHAMRVFRYFHRPATFSLLLILFLLPAASPARTTPTPTATVNRPTAITVDDSSSYNSTTWRNFARLLNLEKGSQVTGVSELKKYFHRFGYLPSLINFTDIFDSSLESAVLNYQKNLGLPVTGKLNSETIHLIMSPRCGVGDSDTRAAASPAGNSLLHTTKHYTLFNGRPRWVRSSPMTLTYSFSDEGTIDYISKDDIRTVFSRAFARWAKVIPVNFTEVENYRTADIKIGFYSGDHGDGEAFDGVLGVLAHAFSPENGRLHLDGAETWSVDFDRERSRVAVDLESVATHEIGHALGLAHSTVKDAIMYPSLSPRSTKVDLQIDDVAGIQNLYGSNPNFKFSSLVESEETSQSGGVDGGWKFGSSWWWRWAILLGLTQLIFTTL